MHPCRLLVVDDDPHFRLLAEILFASDPQIVVVGLAPTAATALALVQHHAPDTVLMDGGLPDMNGLDATRQLKAQPAPPCVIVWSAHDDAATRREAVAVGADGFVAKATCMDTLLPLLHQVCRPPC